MFVAHLTVRDLTHRVCVQVLVNSYRRVRITVDTASKRIFACVRSQTIVVQGLDIESGIYRSDLLDKRTIVIESA